MVLLKKLLLSPHSYQLLSTAQQAATPPRPARPYLLSVHLWLRKSIKTRENDVLVEVRMF